MLKSKQYNASIQSLLWALTSNITIYFCPLINPQRHCSTITVYKSRLREQFYPWICVKNRINSAGAFRATDDKINFLYHYHKNSNIKNFLSTSGVVAALTASPKTRGRSIRRSMHNGQEEDSVLRCAASWYETRDSPSRRQVAESW